MSQGRYHFSCRHSSATLGGLSRTTWVAGSRVAVLAARPSADNMFALEGDPRDYDTDAETLTLDVDVAPAA